MNFLNCPFWLKFVKFALCRTIPLRFLKCPHNLEMIQKVTLPHVANMGSIERRELARQSGHMGWFSYSKRACAISISTLDGLHVFGRCFDWILFADALPPPNFAHIRTWSVTFTPAEATKVQDASKWRCVGVDYLTYVIESSFRYIQLT